MEVKGLKNRPCILCSFLIAAKGNWRNSIFIECGNKCPNKNQLQCSGFLMAPDSKGWPLLIPISAIFKITGVMVDKNECLSIISCHNFELLYSSWLDWHVSSPNECPLFQAFNNSSQSFC